MQYSQFEAQIDRLRSVYSGSSLSPERVKVWWEAFKNANGETFERALSHIIAEATTQALPAVSRVKEAMQTFGTTGTTTAMREIAPAWNCPPCRDFGYGWVGDTIVPCTCERGRVISPAELARQQGNYDRGAKYMKKLSAAIGQELPYDPKERDGA